MTTKKRVLIIGLDGATFDLIKPWAEQGYLPHLSHLMKEGTYGPLQSTIQPTTAPAWATCITGVNQGKHGLYDFVRRRPNSYNLEVTNAAQVATPNIFDIAGQNNNRTVTINIPYTFPLRPLNGIMIGGPFMPTFTKELVSPPDMFNVIKQLVPDYFIIPDFDHRAPDPMAAYAEKLLQGIEFREKLCLHFLGKESWDLFMAVFMATDEVQHTFWHCLDAPDTSPLAPYRDAIRNVYQRIDQAIGNMLSQIAADHSGRETIVFILSDHGAGPFRWMINLNRWLANTGYLKFHSETKAPMQRLKTSGIKQLAQAYRRHLPAKIRASIRARLGAHTFSRVKEEFESALLTSAVDWGETKAYALGAGGNIYINLKDREPDGIIQPGKAYEQLRNEIIDALMTMVEPETGDVVVRKVHKREELYSGPKLADAPDLIIEWVDYACWGRGQYDGGETVFEAQRHLDFSDQPLTGSHRPKGILIAHGTGIRSGEQITEAHLLDMAPTILSILGIQPLPEMDGGFLTALFKDTEIKQVQQAITESTLPVESAQLTISPEEEEAIAKHLRALGYL